MNVVRNIVFLTASVVAAAVAVSAAGLFAVVVQTPSNPITNPSSGNGNGNGNGNGGSGVGTTVPALPAGAQIAFGSANGVTPANGTTAPTTPSDATGGVQGFVSSFPSDYAANYAATSAPLLQAYIDGLRSAANVSALAYDSVLGQAAANLISDTIASGTAIPTQTTAVNSKGQTPIQQVKAVDPTSKASYVSVLTFVSDVMNSMEATDPQTGLNPAEVNFQSDSNMIPTNPGWTHYGFAVVTVPAVANKSNATRYYVIFFAKE